MLDKESFVIKAFSAGASGYLLKSITPDELVFAIRHISLANRYICSELALRFLDRLVALPVITEKALDLSHISFTISLSERCYELLFTISTPTAEMLENN